MRRCESIWRACAALCVTAACLSLTAVAQSNEPGEKEAAARPVPQRCWLRVTGSDVNIRSRPDTNSLVMTRVPRGTLLAAEGLNFGWYTIIPPSDTFSYVAAEYIDRRTAEQGIVSVRSGQLRVRVGSTVQNVNPQDCEVQALLPRGTPVYILGQKDGWYKILPPPNVRGYIAEEHVERLSDEAAAALQPTTAPATPAKPTPTPDVAVAAPVPTEPPASQPSNEPDLSGPWGQRLVALEADIQAEARKPLEEQSWDGLIERLGPLTTQAEEPLVARLAAAWRDKLERRAAGQSALQAAGEVLQSTARQRAQHERELQRIEQLRLATPRQSLYDAEGELQRSFVPGARIEERWYKLQDPTTQKVTVYLEFDPRTKIDPAAYEGKFIGVRGERRFDPKLGSDVLRVISVTDLESERPRPEPTTRDS